MSTLLAGLDLKPILHTALHIHTFPPCDGGVGRALRLGQSQCPFFWGHGWSPCGQVSKSILSLIKAERLKGNLSFLVVELG